MTRSPSTSLPRVGIRWRGRTKPALPLALRGEEVCLVLQEPPPEGEDLDVLLDWPGGAKTELGGRLRDVAFDGRIACVDIRRVQGDWVPFLSYLGLQAAG